MIPTRDRPDALRRCLAAMGVEGLELVVVDDGSRDRATVAAVVEQVGGRVIRTPGVGPAAARNVGARAAVGEVVCFTDDDCEPGPGWATDAGRGGGWRRRGRPHRGSRRIEQRPIRASQAIVEYLTLSSLDEATGRLGFAPTCNLAVTREALAAPAVRRVLSARRRRGPRLERPRRPSQASRPFTRPRPWSSTARSSPSARSSASRRHTGAGRRDTGRPLPAGGWGDRGSTRGLVRRGFREGAAVGALVVAAQLATAAGVASERWSGQ